MTMDASKNDVYSFGMEGPEQNLWISIGRASEFKL